MSGKRSWDDDGDNDVVSSIIENRRTISTSHPDISAPIADRRGKFDYGHQGREGIAGIRFL
jgi:hypothetical protein